MVSLPDLAELPPTLTVPEAAELLGCSPSALYESIRAGDAPVKVLRVGRAIRVPTKPTLELLGLAT
jgi:excisionase family DNA binding protein